MDVNALLMAHIYEGNDTMKPTKLLTLGLLAASIVTTQPGLAQDRGASAPDRSEAAQDRGEPERGTDETREDERPGTNTRPVPNTTQVAELRVGTRNTTTAGGPISQEELELTCGAGGWLETWLEDGDGNPIPGTYEYYCLDA